MKHNKYDVVSYINDKKKVIHAKIIEFGDNQSSVDLFKTWGLNIELEGMYLLKTRKGHKVWKFENDVKLVKNTRLEKLERICNDN